jgi:hypothetical protein
VRRASARGVKATPCREGGNSVLQQLLPSTPPHPMAVLRRDRHLEDAADDDTIVQHIKAVLLRPRRSRDAANTQ